jgi:hypothetical protein
MAVAYGKSITAAPLRHAMLAYAAVRLSLHDERFRLKVETHKDKVVTALSRKLQTPQLVVDADIFASFYLTWTAMYQHNADQSFVHAVGCLNILTHLTETDHAGKRPHYDFLSLFAPLIKDSLRDILLIDATGRYPTS